MCFLTLQDSNCKRSRIPVESSLQLAPLKQWILHLLVRCQIAQIARRNSHKQPHTPHHKQRSVHTDHRHTSPGLLVLLPYPLLVHPLHLLSQ